MLLLYYGLAFVDLLNFVIFTIIFYNKYSGKNEIHFGREISTLY